MSKKGELRRGESFTKMTVLEFYQGVNDECEEEAEKLREELKMTADILSRRPSPRSQRHSTLFRNVSSKMLGPMKKDLESRVYKELWEEANAAVFRNLAS